MKAYFDPYQQAQLGHPFASIRELGDAHKSLYLQERTNTLWLRLSDWFDRVEAVMHAAGIP
jgi:hypothetical protein